jgi:hypothetical protein
VFWMMAYNLYLAKGVLIQTKFNKYHLLSSNTLCHFAILPLPIDFWLILFDTANIGPSPPLSATMFCLLIGFESTDTVLNNPGCAFFSHLSFFMIV